ncbi:hypothetical protein CEXT_307071 [Caerostris extrusa]|uniref:Uncharacterized protein n=1 Tax=Caerostris extrusa TaxID=172846 RepID=A0AAV4QGC2_CAEEX|nr:hypothetical protein CEXT_307071 [Caerostris extrusa]
MLPTYFTFPNGKAFTPWVTLPGIHAPDVLHLSKWKSLHALSDPSRNIYSRHTSPFQMEKRSRLALPCIYTPDVLHLF